MYHTPPPNRACWTCEYFAGTVEVCGLAGRCTRPGCSAVRSMPQDGCSAWEASTRVPMRLLVCGGRDFDGERAAFLALDKVLAKRQVVVVIHGAARGADTIADRWAEARGIERMPFEVTREEWRRIGPSAGPKRNARMLADGRPDGVVALPGGRGTEDMVMQALSAGLPVWRPLG